MDNYKRGRYKYIFRLVLSCLHPINYIELKLGDISQKLILHSVFVLILVDIITNNKQNVILLSIEP